MKTTESTSKNRPAARARRVHPLVLFLVGALLTAAAAHSCYGPEPDFETLHVLPDGDVVYPPVLAADHSAEIRRYNAEVAEALDRHLRLISDFKTAFETGLRERGPNRFAGVRAAIPGIQESFDGFGVMSGVVKDGAMDKVFGGDRLQERFNAALDGPFVEPCARAGASLIADFETFNARLEAETEAFSKELGEAHGRLSEPVRAGYSPDLLQRNKDEAFKTLRRMPLHAGLVAGAAAIEAATIRSTAAAAKRLALRYGAKAIGKAAVSAAAPVADGPFPAGDIVAVGCAIWTISDVYDLKDILPREIGKSLTSAVDRMQAQTISTVQKSARQAYDAHVAAARTLAKAACSDDCQPSVD